MSADGINHRTFHANHRRIYPTAAGAWGKRLGGIFRLVEPFQRPQARCSGAASDPHVASSDHPDEVELLKALHLLVGYTP